jgi:hypothetical protein
VQPPYAKAAAECRDFGRVFRDQRQHRNNLVSGCVPTGNFTGSTLEDECQTCHALIASTGALKICRLYEDYLLTTVPVPVTHLPLRSVRAPFRKGKPERRKRGAVPARGIANPLPGGSGSPVDRQKDRSARSVLNRRQAGRAGKTLAKSVFGKPGSGAEPSG